MQKPLKRLVGNPPQITGLKPGANESKSLFTGGSVEGFA
jgi:hypothetical protein